MEAYKSFFHASVALAFPGGYRGALARIGSGDPEAMEAAICFLELRPYFFRSGYMFKALVSQLKRADLADLQRARFNAVLVAYQTWREQRRAARRI